MNRKVVIGLSVGLGMLGLLLFVFFFVFVCCRLRKKESRVKYQTCQGIHLEARGYPIHESVDYDLGGAGTHAGYPIHESVDYDLGGAGTHAGPVPVMIQPPPPPMVPARQI